MKSILYNIMHKNLTSAWIMNMNFCRKEADCSIFELVSNFNSSNTKLKECSTLNEVLKVIKLFNWFQSSTYETLLKTTGCKNKCRRITYEIVKETEKVSFNAINISFLNAFYLQDIDWKTNWLSELYVNADNDVVEERDEFKTFDSLSLFSSVGGYLGNKNNNQYYL